MDRAHGALGSLLTRKLSRKRDLELEVGARAHFEDAAYYTDAYADRGEDVAYYASVARGHSSVLEHGVGNGRIALPVARAGSAVTGIDHSAPMLADLRRILGAEPADVRRRITLKRGDLRRTRLGRRFPLVICPFNTALHLYTRQDVETWLDRVREHLTPDGELVFDVSMPVMKDLARNPATAYRAPAFVHPTEGKVSYHEHFDYDAVRQILFVSMFFTPEKPKPRPNAGRKTREPFMTPLAHRQFFPQELEALLHYNGFEVRALYGDFARGPLIARSDVMVWHARPRRRR